MTYRILASFYVRYCAYSIVYTNRSALRGPGQVANSTQSPNHPAITRHHGISHPMKRSDVRASLRADMMMLLCVSEILRDLYETYDTYWTYTTPRPRKKGDTAMRYLIREKFFRLGEDSEITDESGRPVFLVDGKVFTLHSTLIVRDVEGNEVATVRKQLIALRPTYDITVKGQELAEVRKKLFSPFIDRYTIDIPGPDDLTITGSLFEHEFTVRRGDQQVATVSKAWISLTDTYGVDIAPGENDLLILTSILALDLAEDQERAGDHD